MVTRSNGRRRPEGIEQVDGPNGHIAASALAMDAGSFLDGSGDMVAVPRELLDRLIALARLSEPELSVTSAEAEWDTDAADEERARPALDAAVGLARYIYQLRRLRGLHFDVSLFSEPAWDMLLDLYVRSGEGRATFVSAACSGAAVPSTTALRWLGQLEERGLIVKEVDRSDGRRSYVRLSPEAILGMERLLRDARILMRPLGGFPIPKS